MAAIGNDGYGPGDQQTMGYFARQYLEGGYESDRQVAKEEWQKLVNDWEDGLTDIEPPDWKEFCG